MADILEMIMVICFGLSWPMNIVKSLRAKTAKGKSILFLTFIVMGYVAGIAGKIIAHNITYVFAFYILNLVMVLIDFCLYFVNRHRDAIRESAETKK
jgi:formate hydrogenlyase subunit 3/multisubunit Na+/H+ antiporter MnhD subunit